ncbi:MAG: hypothetical protein FD157_3104 [Rhodocyclaceae bacterium]|nr:MAG: hypothetical protein FD157_3104 [Rhodocyclaceae bacterium]TND03711.1 MAG: hypothetical protein FD118_1129 [Rhodocyclaceae bacterium]
MSLASSQSGSNRRVASADFCTCTMFAETK